MASNYAYNRLLDDLSKRGFCGGMVDDEPTHVDDFIPESGEVTADQFIGWLLTAEGFDYPADYDPRLYEHYRALKRLFVEHMGSDRVDASRLKWNV